MKYGDSLIKRIGKHSSFMYRMEVNKEASPPIKPDNINLTCAYSRPWPFSISPLKPPILTDSARQVS